MATALDCGCCAGMEAQTPQGKFNRPGLPAVAYRIGTWDEFRATLLARLSSTDYPALAGLTTRRDDDWTIALCDASAALGDVLTFYQERIANESWLRTATERRSVLELARLIGYQLAPGVAASTALAFTLEPAPGQPELAARPVTIPVGARVQSVPDPDQEPHNFETVAAITARVEWNAIPVQTTEPITIRKGLTELYIAGTGNQIQQGDAILIVGSDRETDSSSDLWNVRWLKQVELDVSRNLTRLVLAKELKREFAANSDDGVRVYVFRQRAALFGHNAPDPRLIFNRNNPDENGLTNDATGDSMQWAGFKINGRDVDLDAAYPKIVRDSWFALVSGISAELYRIQGVSKPSRTDFGLSAKITRLRTDHSGGLSYFDLRTTQVLAQSEELALAARPLLYPLFGKEISLADREPDLEPEQLLAVRGKRQRVAFAVDVAGIVFPDVPGRQPEAGEPFVLLDAPRLDLNGGGTQVLAPEALDPSNTSLSGTLIWTLEDHDGTAVAVEAPAGKVVLVPALEEGETVSEICAIGEDSNDVQTDLDRTTLTLQAALAHCYDRATVRVNANVAAATEGESVSEIGGSGNASARNQTFQLKQFPLTYVSDAMVPDGSSATLEVEVNGVDWEEVPTHYGHRPRDRVYALRQDDEGKTTVSFGDGKAGARLPSGQNNVRFAYRKGLGIGGNLRAGQLTTLQTRPAGVKAVVNPEPPTGGQDAETRDDARANAPLRVLTLDRAVSIQDYADFARSFAGIAKAFALWISGARGRGIHLTVAGPGGQIFDADDATPRSLTGTLRNYGDPLIELDVKSYTAAFFALEAAIKVAGDRDPEAVLASVAAALRSAFSFDKRDFGQPVTLDEVYAVIQQVAGVVAADINQLYRVDSGPVNAQPAPRLLAARPAVQPDGTVNAAELLTIEPGAISLGIMP